MTCYLRHPMSLHHPVLRTTNVFVLRTTHPGKYHYLFIFLNLCALYAIQMRYKCDTNVFVLHNTNVFVLHNTNVFVLHNTNVFVSRTTHPDNHFVLRPSHEGRALSLRDHFAIILYCIHQIIILYCAHRTGALDAIPQKNRLIEERGEKKEKKEKKHTCISLIEMPLPCPDVFWCVVRITKFTSSSVGT